MSYIGFSIICSIKQINWYQEGVIHLAGEWVKCKSSRGKAA